MITQEQFVNGVVQYIDNEIMPALPTTGKWVVSTYIVLLASKLPSVLTNLSKNPLISPLGIIDEQNRIDEVAFIEALAKTAKTCGKLTVNIPVVGIMSFSERDIMQLATYLGGTNG